MRRPAGMHQSIGPLAALLLAVAACASESDNPSGLNVCTGGVTLTVDPTPTPDITWVPNCGIAQLVVQETDVPAEQAVRWRIVGDALMPPIHYGTLPSGGSGQPAQPLVVGRTYRVTAHLDRSPSAPVRGSVTFIATVIGVP